MATRTSHSSPCFLRVAEASAASSASKITSLSTPFSLDTASTTIRISLFTRRTSGRQTRLANLIESHSHVLAIDLERDASVINRQQHSGIAPPAGTRLLELDEHPRAHEAPEVRLRTQHPIESRRRHLERIGGRDRVLDVEERRQLTADTRAVIDRNAPFPVDEHPYQCMRAARTIFELDQLEPEPLHCRFDEGDKPLSQGPGHSSPRVCAPNKNGP